MTKSTSQADASRPPNRLISEPSPYLRQHAMNPVEWYPWGKEALERARNEDKPIFLSVGYSACHWCHVMEHESFEDDAIAAVMNRHFVNIKVDREERPDLDQLYMQAVTAMTGSGGWPMSVFLTPGLEPFFGGTYWPPSARWGRPGFIEILNGVHDAWVNRREAVQKQAGELTELVRQNCRAESGNSSLDESLLDHAANFLIRTGDRKLGGFGTAPKFPHPMDLRLAIRLWHRTQRDDLRQLVTITLDEMSRGGIYDHLGGGFARYSTDAKWLVPHFEKMLYDNAQLVPVYLDASIAWNEPRWANVAAHTLDYVLREMTHADGGFFSTQDADSEGVEGKFFVWSRDEVQELLPEQHAELFCRCYDVTAGGNWEHVNILHRVHKPADEAAHHGMTEGELEGILKSCRDMLFAAREKRIHPGRDDKILTGWNGLMIAAMAQAGAVLNNDRYQRAATQAAEFAWRELRGDDGRLWHAWQDGTPRYAAYLDDYACLIDGFTELAIAGDIRWLSRAIELAEQMIFHFADQKEKGFFYTSHDHEELIGRNKDTYDGATPSGNSAAAIALVRLGHLTARVDLIEKGRATLEMMSGQLSRSPLSGGLALQAIDDIVGPTWEFVVAPGADRKENAALIQTLRKRYAPRTRVLVRPEESDLAGQPAYIRELFEGKSSIDHKPTAYPCQIGACQSPLIGADAIEREFFSNLYS